MTMKKTLLFFAAIGILTLGLTSCSKQTDYPNSVVGTIDTIAYNASSNTDVIFQADTTTHNPQITIITSKTKVYTPGTTTQPAITLRVPNAIGYYPIPASASASVVTSATGASGSAAVSGWIEVVQKSSSQRFEGKFSFTAADGTTVTGGQFDGILSYY